VSSKDLLAPLARPTARRGVPQRTRRSSTLPIDHILTVIPARDEADSIGRCLRSVAAARAALPSTISSTIVVVADTCRDDTVLVAASHLDLSRDLLVHTGLGAAGTARRLGVAAGLSATTIDPARVWVCSTDADSTVPVDWFDVHLQAARQGHIAIAGVVELDDATDPMLREQFKAGYPTHPDGSHPHVHAANLGFRADAYVSAGGWAAVATGEDHDLWRRLAPHGGMLASVRLSVTTASRLIGRAPAGFAADLAALVLTSEPAA
jgi:hypothetical protein